MVMTSQDDESRPGKGGPDSSNSQPLVYDAAAEAATLGTCLLGKSDLVDNTRALFQDLPGNPFWVTENAEIWECVCAIRDEGSIADVIAVGDRMPKQRDYLHTLLRDAPFTANPAHPRIVAEYAQKRALKKVLDRGSQQLEETSGRSIAEIKAETMAGLEAIRLVAPTTADQERIASGKAFILDGDQNHESVWGDGNQVLWSKGEALMLCGPPGVGKSTVGGQIVRARIGLRPNKVLGFTVTPGERNTLYLAMDRPRQIARLMRRNFTEADGEVLDGKLVVWKGPPPKDLAQYPETLTQMCVEYDADTVILDSLKDAALGLSNDDVGSAYNRARQHALAEGIEVLELHHQVKRGADGAKPTTLADVYGSRWLTAGAGSVILLWGEAGDEIVKLTHLKQPVEDVGPLTVVHDHVHGTSSVQSVDLVLLAARPGGITAQAAAEVLYDKSKPDKAQVAKARRKLDALVTHGKLLRGGSQPTVVGGTPATVYLAAA